MKDLMKNMLLWVTVAIVLMMVFQGFSPRTGASSGNVLYSEFVDSVRNDRIRKVDIADDGRTIAFERKDNSKGTTVAPRDDRLMDDLINHKVEISQEPASSGRAIRALSILACS